LSRESGDLQFFLNESSIFGHHHEVLIDVGMVRVPVIEQLCWIILQLLSVMQLGLRGPMHVQRGLCISYFEEVHIPNSSELIGLRNHLPQRGMNTAASGW